MVDLQHEWQRASREQSDMIGFAHVNIGETLVGQLQFDEAFLNIELLACGELG